MNNKLPNYKEYVNRCIYNPKKIDKLQRIKDTQDTYWSSLDHVNLTSAMKQQSTN